MSMGLKEILKKQKQELTSLNNTLEKGGFKRN